MPAAMNDGDLHLERLGLASYCGDSAGGRNSALQIFEAGAKKITHNFCSWILYWTVETNTLCNVIQYFVRFRLLFFYVLQLFIVFFVFFFFYLFFISIASIFFPLFSIVFISVPPSSSSFLCFSLTLTF
jgi:hypothetical protein